MRCEFHLRIPWPRLILLQSESRKTWYGGTWPRTPKSSPAIQVAKENISTAGRHEVSKPAKPLRKPSLYSSRNMGSPNRSLPLAATTTKINIISNAAASRECDSSIDEQLVGTGSGPDRVAGNPMQADAGEKETEKARQRRSSADILNAEDKRVVAEGIKGASPGWLGWFLRPVEPHRAANQVLQQDFAAEEAGPSIETVQGESPCKGNVPSEEASDERRNSNPNPISALSYQDKAPRSTWLGFWGTSAQTSDGKPGANEAGATQMSGRIHLDGNLTEATTASFAAPPQVSDQPTAAGKPSGWAFWSRNHSEAPSTSGLDTGTDKAAVAGLWSHSKPGIATVKEATVSSIKEKNVKPHPTEPSNGLRQPSPSKINDSRATISTDANIGGAIDTTRPLKSKQSTVNLLLPYVHIVVPLRSLTPFLYTYRSSFSVNRFLGSNWHHAIETDFLLEGC